MMLGMVPKSKPLLYEIVLGHLGGNSVGAEKPKRRIADFACLDCPETPLRVGATVNLLGSSKFPGAARSKSLLTPRDCLPIFHVRQEHEERDLDSIGDLVKGPDSVNITIPLPRTIPDRATNRF